VNISHPVTVNSDLLTYNPMTLEFDLDTEMNQHAKFLDQRKKGRSFNSKIIIVQTHTATIALRGPLNSGGNYYFVVTILDT